MNERNEDDFPQFLRVKPAKRRKSERCVWHPSVFLLNIDLWCEKKGKKLVRVEKPFYVFQQWRRKFATFPMLAPKDGFKQLSRKTYVDVFDFTTNATTTTTLYLNLRFSLPLISRSIPFSLCLSNSLSLSCPPIPSLSLSSPETSNSARIVRIVCVANIVVSPGTISCWNS